MRISSFTQTSAGQRLKSQAFTLVELLVSCVVIGLLCAVLGQMTDQTAKTWKYTTGKSEEFREARTAFETMTTRISQATLNTYWDYNNTTSPTRYERRSELRFISGNAGTPSTLLGDEGAAKRVSHCIFFHAPFGFVDDTQARSANAQIHGLDGLLNVWGYFVELNDDANLRPPILSSSTQSVPLRVRFRLMEMMAPAEEMPTYQYTSGVGTDLQPKGKTYTGKQWYQSLVNSTKPKTHTLAENVVALILHPELSTQDRANLVKTNGAGGAELAGNYLYDSTATGTNGSLNTKDQLPPVMRVTMVAVDEASAGRLGLTTTSQNIFGVPGKFQQATQFKQDLTLDSSQSADASLENKLVSLKVNYRVFTTTIPIWGSKWSQSQSN